MIRIVTEVSAPTHRDIELRIVKEDGRSGVLVRAYEDGKPVRSGNLLRISVDQETGLLVYRPVNFAHEELVGPGRVIQRSGV